MEIKSGVLDSWYFFPKIVWGAANKVSENKISGKKSPEENKSEEKKNIEKKDFFPL